MATIASHRPPAEPVRLGSDSRTARANWERLYAHRLVVTDLLVVAIAVGSAWYAQFISADVDHASRTHMALTVGLAILWAAALAAFRTRAAPVIGAGVDEYRRVVVATLFTFGAVAIVTLLANATIAREYLMIALPAGLLGLLVARNVWRRRVSKARREGHFQTSVVVLGDAASAQLLAEEFVRDPENGYSVVGACVPGESGRHAERSFVAAGHRVPILGNEDDVVDALVETGSDTLAVTAAHHLGTHRMRRLSWELERFDVDLVVSPGVIDVAGPRLSMRPVSGLPLVHVEKPQYRGATAFTKAAFDRVGAALLVLAIAPLLVAVAVAIKLHDGGPVFFRQRRVGLDGRLFGMWKFRSMVPNADRLIDQMRERADQTSATFYKAQNDPRITPIGRFIRKTSIDELPQLFNVLTGDMSLVGPRPLVVGEGAEIDGFVERRMLVRPGITGLWQVSGRSDLPEDERVRLDLYYVDNWSILQDLLIMWRTLRAVVRSDGAY